MNARPNESENLILVWRGHYTQDWMWLCRDCEAQKPPKGYPTPGDAADAGVAHLVAHHDREFRRGQMRAILRAAVSRLRARDIAARRANWQAHLVLDRHEVTP